MILKEVTKRWEDVYEQPTERLPWLNNPIPTKVLDNFCEKLNPNDLVLDYGCGDGLLAEYLVHKDLSVVCSEISENALQLVKSRLPDVPLIQVAHPKEFLDSIERFQAVLVWGVMHHIDRDVWGEYIDGFLNLLKPGGFLLIGGHSTKDKEFSEGYRTSPTTGLISCAVDGLEGILKTKDGVVLESGYFDFTEAFSGNHRAFKNFLFQKSY